jgi:hypothetical protein
MTRNGNKWAVEPCPLCNGKNMMTKGARSCMECRYSAFKSVNRKCTKCGADLNNDNWSESNQYNHYNICHDCFMKQSNEVYKTRRVWYKDKNQALKKKVIDHYGGKCACCGIDDLIFLTLDHILDDGNIHRDILRGNKKDHRGGGGNKTYKWAVDNSYPPVFQVLCFNCNWAKSHGGCPHQGKRREYDDVVIVTSPKKIHKCNKCGMEFGGSGNLASHVRYKHPQAMEFKEQLPQ